MTKYEEVKAMIPAGVQLLAVSKTKSPEEIRAVYDQGQRDFGENRVRELLEKEAEPALAFPDMRWHLIGTLQKNKVKHVVGKVVLIHSVDSKDLLERIAKRAASLGIVQDVLLQVNYSGEASKHGLEPDDVWALILESSEWSGIRIRGLMTMSGLAMSVEEKLAYYKRFHLFFTDLKARMVDCASETALNPDSFDILSIGMSGDYHEAIEAGSTMVRLGTAIFGPRS